MESAEEPKEDAEKPKYRNWVFTFNNWHLHEFRHARFHDFDFDENVRYVAFSYEIGATTGTPHLQGVAVLWGDRTKDWVIEKFPAGIRWDHMRGTFEQACDIYCGKNGNQIFEFGEAPMKGRRTDIISTKRLLDQGVPLRTVATMENHYGTVMKFHKSMSIYAGWQKERIELANAAADYAGFIPRDWQKGVLDILAGPVVPRKIHWLWEATGGCGKSYFAGYLEAVRGAFLHEDTNAKEAYFLYQQQGIVVFDMPRDASLDPLYTMLEHFKNGRITSTKYEPVVKRMRSPHVFVFANDAPDQRKLSADRWDVVNITLRI